MRNNDQIINYLEQLKNEKHLSISEIARQVGMAKSAVSRYFNRTREFPLNRASQFAKVFNVSVEDILGINNIPDNIMPVDSLIKVPIIGTIACGTPILAEQNISGYQYIPADLVSETENLFFLRCQGNSMQPTIKNGSLVLVHKQPCVEDNEIAAVLINDKATLKRIKHLDGQILLMPDNKDYSPIILKQHDYNRILGKAIQVINEL